jgi:hypothetical protein
MCKYKYTSCRGNGADKFIGERFAIGGAEMYFIVIGEIAR